MLRSLLAVLLLANYLLVVGAGHGLNRAEAPRYSAAHPYVHSKQCQRANYLRVDCFEQCNGEQPAVKAKLPGSEDQHLMSTVKGLDVHCAVECLVLEQQRLLLPLRGARVAAAALVAVPSGFGLRDYPPPRRG